METITSADGTEIAFDRTGNGPPLVLVHGTGGDQTIWEFVRPVLSEYVTCYAMDRRGYGESSDADEYELEREVEDVVTLVESINDPVTLLGHSYGGICTLEAALRTDNLQKLILYEPPISLGDSGSVHEAKEPEMKALLNDGEKEQLVLFFLREVATIQPTLIEHARAAPNWQDRVDAAHAIYREVQAEIEYEFDGARFRDVATPTLLLYGSESPSRFKRAIEAVDNALPDSRVATFEGQEHVAQYTAPNQFIEEVLGFIER